MKKIENRKKKRKKENRNVDYLEEKNSRYRQRKKEKAPKGTEEFLEGFLHTYLICAFLSLNQPLLLHVTTPPMWSLFLFFY